MTFQEINVTTKTGRTQKACIGTVAVDVFSCDLKQSPTCVSRSKRSDPTTQFLKCYPGPFAVSTGHFFSDHIQCI